jgi:hypothetical protein
LKSFRLAIGLAVFSALYPCTPAHAYINLLSWVSGSGSDSNPCTYTAPCATWNAAIATVGEGGEVDALSPGAFGYISITKSITINGGPFSTTVATSNNNPVVTVNMGPTDVATIRNLYIQGSAVAGVTNVTGINFSGGGALHIEHCVISGAGLNGIYIGPATQPAGGSEVFIEDTTVQDSTYDGLFILGQSSTANVHVTVSNSRFTGNGTYGIQAGDYSRVTVKNSEASGNGQAGYFALASNGTTILSMIDSVATNNSAGGVIAGGGSGISTVRIANMGLFNNITGFSTATNGAIVSFGNNNNSGNGTPTGSIAQE